MGLFDNVFDSKATGRDLSKPEAFAGILIGASACDGHIAEEEMRSLSTITCRMKLFDGITEQKWQSIVDSLQKILKHDGVDKLLDRCAAALPEELRDCVFANACDIILADRDVENEEKEFLDRLQNKLGIDGDTALTIVEVLVIKNKG
jgi:uncharacterized membrane protein YebE (DUF533 family)